MCLIWSRKSSKQHVLNLAGIDPYHFHFALNFYSFIIFFANQLYPKGCKTLKSANTSKLSATQYVFNKLGVGNWFVLPSLSGDYILS